MGELNLDAIRGNADWYRFNREGREGAVEAHAWCAAAIACADDVPALLAEVNRLRAVLGTIAGHCRCRGDDCPSAEARAALDHQAGRGESGG